MFPTVSLAPVSRPIRLPLETKTFMVFSFSEVVTTKEASVAVGAALQKKKTRFISNDRLVTIDCHFGTFMHYLHFR